MTSGLVDGAGLVRDVVLCDPLESGEVVASVAPVGVILATEEYLRSDVDIGPGGFSGDFNSVAEDGGRGERPAGSAVDGNVLVSGNSQVVCSVDIRPLPSFWQIINGNGGQFGSDPGLDFRWVLHMAGLILDFLSAY